ncbi:hypothetical protein FKP32DRAFT_1600062 [Trametes sanguinea]|nr:hypothetical protein FKP32DRAFT_1600062 [Trametes sanguinea]
MRTTRARVRDVSVPRGGPTSPDQNTSTDLPLQAATAPAISAPSIATSPATAPGITTQSIITPSIGAPTIHARPQPASVGSAPPVSIPPQSVDTAPLTAVRVTAPPQKAVSTERSATPSSAGSSTISNPGNSMSPWTTLPSSPAITPSYSPLPRATADGFSIPSSTPHSAQLALKVEEARQARSEDEGYLATGKNTLHEVKWGDALALAEARAAYATQGTGNADEFQPEAKAFTVLGTISDDNFFMRSDGNFGSGGFERKFSATALACALIAPPSRFTGAASDFHAAMSTLDAYMALDKGGENSETSFKHHGKNEVQGAAFKQYLPRHVRLRHAVFEEKPRTLDAAGDDLSPDVEVVNVPVDGLEDTDPYYHEYTTAGWPTHNNANAAEALKAIVKSHFVRPLNAYDVNGRLIPPSRYHLELRGATVVVSFTAKHYDIFDRNKMHKDVYNFDIEYIRVLVPGSLLSQSPSKRSIPQRDPWDKGKKVRRA